MRCQYMPSTAKPGNDSSFTAQASVQSLAPLLVQAQFDMNSEAGKKITFIWGSLVSSWLGSRRVSSGQRLCSATASDHWSGSFHLGTAAVAATLHFESSLLHFAACASQVKDGIRWYRDESIRTRVYSSPVLHDDEPQPPRPDKVLWKQVTVRPAAAPVRTPAYFCVTCSLRNQEAVCDWRPPWQL